MYNNQIRPAPHLISSSLKPSSEKGINRQLVLSLVATKYYSSLFLRSHPAGPSVQDPG